MRTHEGTMGFIMLSCCLCVTCCTCKVSEVMFMTPAHICSPSGRRPELGISITTSGPSGGPRSLWASITSHSWWLLRWWCDRFQKHAHIFLRHVGFFVNVCFHQMSYATHKPVRIHCEVSCWDVCTRPLLGLSARVLNHSHKFVQREPSTCTARFTM